MTGLSGADLRAPAENRAERIAVSDNGTVIEVTAYRGADKLAIVQMASPAGGLDEIGRSLQLVSELLGALIRHFCRRVREIQETAR